MRLIIIVAAVMSGFVFISLLFFQATRKTYPGFSRWTVGVGFLTVGYIALAMRGFIPDSLSILPGNVAFPLGMVVLLDGLRRFLGLTPMSRIWYALPAMDLAGVAVLYYLHDSAYLRSVVTAIAISAPHWPMAAYVFRHPVTRKSIFYPVIGSILGLAGLVVLARPVTAFFLPQWHLLMDSPFQLGSFLTLVVLQLGESLSLMILNSERVESELVETQAELNHTVDRLQQSLTAQEHVEESLRESEERYRNFFETSRDCVFMTTVDGQFVEVNDISLEVFGYTSAEKQELLQRNVASFYANPEEREAHAALVSRMGFCKEYPVAMRRKDGTIIDALITTVARKDLHGNVIGFQGTVRDLTEARKTDEALRDKTRELGERVKELRCLYSISELVERQKVSLDESLQSILNLISPAWQYPEVTCARIILNDAEFTTEHYREPVSKQSAHLIVHGEICGALEVGYLEKKPERDEGPFLKEERRLINAIAERLGRVVERMRAEETLRKEREFTETALDSQRDTFFLFEPATGRATRWNRAFRDITGYTDEEIAAMPAPDSYYSPEDLERARMCMQQILETGTFTIELELICKDGRKIPTEYDASLVKDLDGTPRYIVSIGRSITDRKQAEAALRESEARYRFLAEHASDILWTVDMQMRTTYVSPSVHKVLGFTPEERMQQNVSDQLTSESFDVARQKLLDELRTEQEQGVQPDRSVVLELDFLHKDGSTVCLESVMTFIRDERGVPIGCHGLSRDITERKRAEEELLETRQMLQTVLDTIPAAVFWKDRDLLFLGGNRAWLEAAGMKSPDDVVGKSDYDLPWDKAQADSFRESDRKVVESGTPEYNIIEPYRLADGTQAWASTTKVPLRDVQGNIVGILGTYEDITDRKKAKDALLESEETFRSVFEHSPEGIILGAPDGTAFTANPAACRMLGRSDEEIREVGRDGILDLTDPRLARALEERMRTGRFRGELTCKRKDGTTFPVEGASGVFRNAQGQLRTCMIFKDITEKKRYEMEKENLQAQLIQAQKMEAIGTLTGGIAHDFNNLLTIINGFAEMVLMEKTDDDPSYSDLQKILETGRKGADLVQKLLTVIKRGEINPQPTDLNRLVESSVTLMERTFPKMIEIKTILQKNLGTVSADSGQIEQVLMSLCINAQEAMPEGGRLIIETRSTFIDEQYCRLQPGAKPGPHVLIEISDTGRGMSKETMERIFDPFFTTKGWDFKKGTGLGVPVAKGIVEQHGGWITCESEMGVGTTLRVYLPAIEDSPSEQTPGLAAETVPGGAKILLVDDEEYVRDLGKRILERSGYTVITAENGEAALAIYGKERSNIALVILDLVMPQMGGERCLKELLTMNPDVKVIVSSGDSLSARARDDLGVLVKGFVNKPYEVGQMMQTVKRVLTAE